MRQERAGTCFNPPKISARFQNDIGVRSRLQVTCMSGDLDGGADWLCRRPLLPAASPRTPEASLVGCPRHCAIGSLPRAGRHTPPPPDAEKTSLQGVEVPARTSIAFRATCPLNAGPSFRRGRLVGVTSRCRHHADVARTFHRSPTFDFAGSPLVKPRLQI